MISSRSTSMHSPFNSHHSFQLTQLVASGEPKPSTPPGFCPEDWQSDKFCFPVFVCVCVFCLFSGDNHWPLQHDACAGKGMRADKHCDVVKPCSDSRCSLQRARGMPDRAPLGPLLRHLFGLAQVYVYLPNVPMHCAALPGQIVGGKDGEHPACLPLFRGVTWSCLPCTHNPLQHANHTSCGYKQPTLEPTAQLQLGTCQEPTGSLSSL